MDRDPPDYIGAARREWRSRRRSARRSLRVEPFDSEKIMECRVRMYAAVIVERKSGIVRFLRPADTHEAAVLALLEWIVEDNDDDPDDPLSEAEKAEMAAGYHDRLVEIEFALPLDGFDLAQVVECG